MRISPALVHDKSAFCLHSACKFVSIEAGLMEPSTTNIQNFGQCCFHNKILGRGFYWKDEMGEAEPNGVQSWLGWEWEKLERIMWYILLWRAVVPRYTSNYPFYSKRNQDQDSMISNAYSLFLAMKWRPLTAASCSLSVQALMQLTSLPFSVFLISISPLTRPEATNTGSARNMQANIYISYRMIGQQAIVNTFSSERSRAIGSLMAS